MLPDEISDDFACITLEMLFNITNSPAASLPIKLAAARIFAKFKCSYSVAKKAYKVVAYFFTSCLFLSWNYHIFCFLLSYVMPYLMQIGLELISNSSNKDILVIMLFSISKLASISTLLTSNLVRAFLLYCDLGFIFAAVSS